MITQTSFRKILAVSLFAIASLGSPVAQAAMGYGCGTACMAQLNGYCPTCAMNGMNGGMNGMGQTPWGSPTPFYWNTGPMMYPNFYQPAPWIQPPPPQGMMMQQQQPMFSPYPAPQGYPSPGVNGGYFPGSGQMWGAKPNLYLIGKVGTHVKVELKLIEPGANWLVAVPTHGTQGWEAEIAERNKLKSGGGTYGYLYSDYRTEGKEFQDQEGFCAAKPQIISKMAIQLKTAGFSGREIADFMEYWSVKMPPSEGYCVYPQDERQLEKTAPLEITPQPTAIRRVLFMVQVREGLRKDGGKFAQAPARAWHPLPLRLPASQDQGLVAREWGVGFLTAKPGTSK